MIDLVELRKAKPEFDELTFKEKFYVVIEILLDTKWKTERRLEYFPTPTPEEIKKHEEKMQKSEDSVMPLYIIGGILVIALSNSFLLGDEVKITPGFEILFYSLISLLFITGIGIEIHLFLRYKQRIVDLIQQNTILEKNFNKKIIGLENDFNKRINSLEKHFAKKISDLEKKLK